LGTAYTTGELASGVMNACPFDTPPRAVVGESLLENRAVKA
jgi:hypothetical protein